MSFLASENRSSFAATQSSPYHKSPREFVDDITIRAFSTNISEAANEELCVICHRLVSQDLRVVKRRLMYSQVALSCVFTDCNSANQEDRLQ